MLFNMPCKIEAWLKSWASVFIRVLLHAPARRNGHRFLLLGHDAWLVGLSRSVQAYLRRTSIPILSPLQVPHFFQNPDIQRLQAIQTSFHIPESSFVLRSLPCVLNCFYAPWKKALSCSIRWTRRRLRKALWCCAPSSTWPTLTCTSATR